jgi:chromosome segregation ATPase
MIQSLAIQHFQSHKSTELKFHPGFNAIIGSTDSGKSAIYRSMYWTRYNKAVNFVSFWNRKKDGNPKEDTSATITNGISISRIRGPALNGYVLGDKETLAAIGREVPRGVIDALNLSDINFFSQHNPPFLLTETAGKVAEILNELIHLDDIDRILTLLDQKKRANKKSLDETTAALDEAQSKLVGYSWLDKAEEAIALAQIVEKELDDVTNSIYSLSQLLAVYMTSSVYYEKSAKITLEAQPLIAELDTITKELEEVVQKFNTLSSVMASIQKIQDSLKKLESIDATDELVECDTVQRELSALSEDLEQLTDWIEKYNQKQALLLGMDMEIKGMTAELGSMPLCSECGRPLEECDE